MTISQDALSLAELRSANVARNAEWNTGAEQVSLAFRGNELAGEVGEACNVLKKLERERIGIRGSRATKDQAAEELADVVICVDLTAMDLGIDLGQAIRDKFNATSMKYDLATRLTAPKPTAAEAPGQEPAAVKPLEWEPWDDGTSRAESSIGQYRIFPGTGFSFEAWGPAGGRIRVAKQRSVAEASAQADYEQRIRSALVSAPPTYADAEAKGDERLCWFMTILDGMGGHTDVLDRPYEWLTCFCDDRPTGSDTFNIAIERGLMTSYYDGDLDHGSADITPAGREFAAAIRSLASPAPKGEA